MGEGAWSPAGPSWLWLQENVSNAPSKAAHAHPHNTAFAAAPALPLPKPKPRQASWQQAEGTPPQTPALGTLMALEALWPHTGSPGPWALLEGGGSLLAKVERVAPRAPLRGACSLAALSMS